MRSTRLAIKGEGDVRRLMPIDPPEYRLRVGKWRVRFQIDHSANRLLVLHVLRRDEAY
jgi:mRNA-degrading endonuclease RelE of RelBE toxin-antitoxin system